MTQETLEKSAVLAWCEHEIEIVKMLLLAHGGSAFAAISFLGGSSGNGDTMIRGAKFYAGCFCIGFALAALGLVPLSTMRQAYLMGWNEPGYMPSKLQIVVAGLALLASGLILLLTITMVGLQLLMT